MAATPELMGSTPTDGDDLARRIAEAGLQVSQAVDELQQAAERLTDAEERAREAEARAVAAEEQAREAERRRRTVEEQLAEGATRNAELLEVLERTRWEKAEADERSRRSEDQLKVTVDRARLSEEQIVERESQIQALESRIQEAESRPEVTLIVDDERTALQEAVAADVRRPLTSILGLTLALKHADPQSSEGADMVKQLATNARKLDRLVGEMLAIDKIVSGAYEPNLRRTDLEALVRRVVEESADLHGRDAKVEAEHVAIQVDPALTEQIVETLLCNAGRRTAPGSPVWVKISSDQGGAVIAVDDTGPEVPPGLRGAMVAAPSDEGRAERQNKPRGATGLTLLARLAEIHAGRAWVEERPGGGASFRVFLPDGREPHEESMDERAAARVHDDEDVGAIALARALVEADNDASG